MNWDLVIGVGVVVVAVASYLLSRRMRGKNRQTDLNDPESTDSVRQDYENWYNRNTLGGSGN